MRDNMLGLRGLTTLGLSILAPLYRVRGVSSPYSDDAAGAILAQNLALANVTFNNSNSNFLGVTPSDPIEFTVPLTGLYSGGSAKIVIKDFARPWIPKVAFEDLVFEFALRFPRVVSLFRVI